MPSLSCVELTPIGVVRSPVREGRDDDWGSVTSQIELRAELADGLRGIDSYSHAVPAHVRFPDWVAPFMAGYF